MIVRSVLLLVLSLTLAGCGGGSQPSEVGAGNEGGILRLGAVLPMFSHPFFIAQRNGLLEEAAKRGVRIDVRDGQDDDQKQIVQVEALIGLKPDLIILCPRDENALVAAVESANRAGIPILTMNRRVNGGQVVCYVGADDEAGGHSQAEALVEALGEQGGAIIYLQGLPGSSPQVSREQGFKEVITRHPEITIAAEPFADFQEDKAKELMTGLVRRFQPGQIQAIVAQADEMALPAAEVATAAGWTVPVIGFNGTREAFEAIRAGQLHATILQDAAEQGRLAVQVALDHLSGEKPASADVHTPLPVINNQNIDQYQPAY